jgi:hypothetical protein
MSDVSNNEPEDSSMENSDIQSEDDDGIVPGEDIINMISDEENEALGKFMIIEKTFNYPL